MVDSNVVLAGQMAGYTLYVLAIMALMAWFSYRVTKQTEQKGVKPAAFYSFVGVLIVLGVSLHITTYKTIPWAYLDHNRGTIEADRTFDIRIEKHRFQLPGEKLVINCGEKVLFKVSSDDLTYGFGLFRKDHSMVFQMQVIPGHINDILWHFERPGIFTIRSTEYSGPAGINMIIPDVVEVVCNHTNHD
jgi:cytochrome c oxidase subunit 2